MPHMVLAYDVETFKMVFTAIFKNVNNPSECWEFVALEDGSRNDIPKLIDFIHTVSQPERSVGGLTLVSHNGIGFDDIVLRAILTYPTIKPSHLHRLAMRLIARDFDSIPGINDLRFPKESLWRTIDTLAITRVNQIRISLKHAGVILRHRWLQELPYSPEETLTTAQVDELVRYNHNDVDIQVKLYHALAPLLAMRREVGDFFEVDILSSNDTEIAKEILTKSYKARIGAAAFKKMADQNGTPRERIYVRECIGKNIVFLTDELIDLRSRLEKLVLYEASRYKYRIDLNLGGVEYKIGVGGLHSKDAPGIFESTDDVMIIDADVASYYPNILLLNRFTPAHLDDEFLDEYRQIVIRRLQAKGLSKTDRLAAIEAQGLKIAINSGFGLTNSPYFWLYDPQTMASITISGQLYLLDLIEKLHLAGIQTLSANTDGIVCQVRREQKDLYDAVCAEWAERTGFELEFTPYRRYIRRDVNNYITVKNDGKVKTKGIFQGQFYYGGNFYDLKHYNGFIQTGIVNAEPEVPTLQKGYDAPIVTIALYQYFVHGVPVQKTIRDHQDVRDFAIATRVDKSKFKAVYSEHPVSRARTPLPHYNRYVVGKKGGYLIKWHANGTRVSAVAGRKVLVLNDLDETGVSGYDLDYSYYIERCEKEINQIQPREKMLW